MDPRLIGAWNVGLNLKFEKEKPNITNNGNVETAPWHVG